ncbi:MAG: multifunctional CCA addition/repair protein [Gammaproteobacteria bacterium]|nr:MAG: multifunctional CCA addition/repair protein [Gammaproteobacteria bacterium]
MKNVSDNSRQALDLLANPDVRIYRVGGAVRDRLLGLTVHENDFVVVGATQQQMIEWGFEQVGADFPVFLHPVSHEEYALARTERKQGQGYKGFVFSTQEVTLEQDLYRRDLTINAIAEDKDGQLIDPCNGQADIENRLLRHVSDAFVEDPVRVLRVARFAARFAHLGFTVADETMRLMRQMVDNGEVSTLVPERVTAEMFKALDTEAPQVFFYVLHQCGALAIVFPEIDALFGVPQRADYHPEIDSGVHVMMCLADAARRRTSRLTRYAVLCHDLGKATTPADILPRHHGHEARGRAIAAAMSTRLKVPKKYRDMGIKTAEFHSHIHRFHELKPKTILKLFKTFGVPKDLSFFAQFVDSCISDCRGRLGFEDEEYPQAKAALRLAYQLQQFDPQPFIRADMRGEEIGKAVEQGQIAFLKNHLGR